MLGDACSDHCKTSKAEGEDIVCHCDHVKCAQEMTRETG